MRTRLEAIYELIPGDATGVCDVGYDHGALLVALARRRPDLALAGIENRRAAASIALAADPLLADLHAEKRVALVEGDGIAPLAASVAAAAGGWAERIDGAVIAGIGGRNIARMLAHSDALANLRWAIFCPPRFNGAIRPAIHRSGWHIAAESLVDDRRHTYEVIVAQRGAAPPGSVSEAAQTDPNGLMARFGPFLMTEETPRMAAYLAAVSHRFRAAFNRELIDYGPHSTKPYLGSKLRLLADAIAAISDEEPA